MSSGYSEGNSYGSSSFNDIRPGPRWPVPTWKFGLRQSDDRGSI